MAKKYEKYKKALVVLMEIEVIDFENRHVPGNIRHVAKVSIDGTDMRINEPTPWSTKWYSHKFHAAGLRYEIGICIVSGDIVWVIGGYACGDWPDLEISRNGILTLLDDGEKVIADSGYRGDDRILHKTGENNSFTARMRAEVRARHETVNARIKVFAVASGKFRHTLDMHTMCIYSVVNIVQLRIMYEGALFEVGYDEF